MHIQCRSHRFQLLLTADDECLYVQCMIKKHIADGVLRICVHLEHRHIIRGSIVVSISACHAEDPGSIPGRGAIHYSMQDWLNRLDDLHRSFTNQQPYRA